MGKIKAALQYAFTAGTVLCGLGTASAEDWKVTGAFGWFGVGKTYQIEKGHFYFVGEFSGTFFNDKGDGSLFDKAGVKCPAFYDIDQNNKKGNAAGYCTISNAGGDQAYVSWKCEGDGVHCNGPFEYTGGTGKYAGITGSNYTFSATTEVNWQDGTVTGLSTWNR
jgi:hypothetical protein